MRRRKIVMIVERTETGFSAYSNRDPIYTTGTTIAELIGNSLEAAQLYFEGESVEMTPSDIKFEIDFKQFFQYYKVLNAKVLAERIGMNPTLLSQYVRGHKKPSDKQTNKILTGIHEIGQELSGINLFQRT